MSVLVAKAKQQVTSCITDAANAAIESGELASTELSDFSVSAPASREHGDYAANAAMVWAKCFHKSPKQIAEILNRHFDFSGTYIEKCEIAGPGFINFFLSDSYYADIISDALEKGESYGRSDYGKGKRVLVEFVSANPTGPMHIG
ncbi:MAG: arginine--tRNA ligase, partial [Acutalibacteraceae bacterium]|nr:arginine--tRNA ligase [Acutalibacteraceae bacterium]